MRKFWIILGWVIFLGLLIVPVAAGFYAIISIPSSIIAAGVGILNWFGWTPRASDDFLTVVECQK